jgi:hypothetical protein
VQAQVPVNYGAIMRELVVIEDSTIASMVNNDKFTAAIPCLFNQKSVLTPPKGSCGSCARRKIETQRAALTNIKNCLIALSAEKKEELKQLLGTKQVTIVQVTATGQVSQVTF